MAKHDQKLMMQTRAELLDVKPKVLAARVRKRLATVRAQLAGIGAAFEDIDMTVVGAGEALMGHFDTFERTLQEAVTYLEEVPECP
jgi:hypothetical protein